ncbi:MAG: hypothetical protein R2855_13470 [Thermomicrobiales bacterium]
MAVPIGERSKLGVIVTGITTFRRRLHLARYRLGRNLMLVHVMDASDPDQIRADMQELYDRYQRKVFP